MQKHFVTFYSPGTFVAEQSTKPIESWDVDAAVRMAQSITERHGARPYGFQFTTRFRNEAELDSSESDRSPMYYLGGEVLTLDQVKARNDPEDRVLISNMQSNGYGRIITSNTPWRWTRPLNDDDVVLDIGEAA